MLATSTLSVTGCVKRASHPIEALPDFPYLEHRFVDKETRPDIPKGLACLDGENQILYELWLGRVITYKESVDVLKNPD